MYKLDNTLIDSLSIFNKNNITTPIIGNITCLINAVNNKYNIYLHADHSSSTFFYSSPIN